MQQHRGGDVMSDGLGGNAATAHTGAQRGRRGAWGALLTLAAVLGLATSAPALILTGGPVYSLPGGGSCSVAGVASQTGGATVSCTGVNLAGH
jgi:hypothetical protein